MDWNLKGGIIIIGSLFWQNYLDENDNNIRKDWRFSHLDIDKRIPVRLPIRYGRISSGIPTMIFSNKMQKRKGFGYVVPFKKLINNRDELLCEAISLSAAEGMKGNFVRKWGVLAYLINDSAITQNIKKDIISLFRDKINMKFNITDYKVGREKSCITKTLKLDIDWIKPVLKDDKTILNSYHFLLATATMPHKTWLSIEEIAIGIKADKNRKYFINNLTNGIITYDDFKISNLL